MGIELTIARELANLDVTLAELLSLSGIVNGQMRNSDFLDLFNGMVADLARGYEAVSLNLSPLSALDSEDSFAADFDDRYAAYNGCYLHEISKPRACLDEAYEKYLVLKTLKESRTGFPLLKRTFGRLDEFVDKWVTNDAWLAMSIDTLFKMIQRLLNEIDGIKLKDPEDAWLIYSTAFADFDARIALIAQKRRLLTEITHVVGKTPVSAI